MKLRLLISFFAICVILFAGCRMKDVRVVTLKTSGIQNEESLKVVEAALKKLPDDYGIMNVESMNYETGEITVRYDSMRVAVCNIEDAISQVGFDTERFSANPDAAKKRSEAYRVKRN